MKTLRRNRSIIYYALPGTVADQVDQYGNITGVAETTYGEPVKYCRLSTRKRSGWITAERYGLTEGYRDTFVTDDMDCPLTVDTHLWIGTEPTVNGVSVPYTHVVDAILPSLNVIYIVAKEVSVS